MPGVFTPSWRPQGQGDFLVAQDVVSHRGGPVLTVVPEAWVEFIGGVKAGDFD
jgi:hypothetical protein